MTGVRTAMVWALVVAAAIGAGAYARPMPFGASVGVGRLLPRTPAPPADLPTLLYQLGVGSVVWYAIVLALPLIWLAARRLEIERHGRVRTVAIAAAAVAALILATSLAEYAVVFRGVARRPPRSAFLIAAMTRNTLPWVAVVSLVGALEGRRRIARSLLAQERFRSQIAEQRLVALTGQLQPHFLFNTLQSISTLIHRDPHAADDMLAKLGDLLRDVLRHRDRVLVPLGDEVRYTQTYLEIAQVRFADRLVFTIDVPRQLHHVSVPLFILQPLVENALAHGIGGRLQGGCITVSGRRTGGRLHLSVEDNGAGPPPRLREGIGLSNTRERLRAAFGADYALSVDARAGGGTVAAIDIPDRPHEQPADEACSAFAS